MNAVHSEQTVTQRKFIFVSYQHENADIVEPDIEWLASKGVNIWYDTDLDYGDNWKKRVERVIRHENCCGVLFYSSETAYCSEPIFFERNLVRELQKERGKDNFFYLPINIGKPSTLQLIREVFLHSPEDGKELEKHINCARLAQIIEMFNSEILSCYADPDNREKYLTSILNELEKKCPDVINSNEIKRKKMEKVAATQKGNRSFPFGKWLQNETSVPGVQQVSDNRWITYQNEHYLLFRGKPYTSAPINWLELPSETPNRLTLIADTIIDIRKSDAELPLWLSGEFTELAFSPSEREFITGPVRLLRESDMDIKSNSALLSAPREGAFSDTMYWWIDSKAFGNNQKVIKTKDGSLYGNGLTANKAVGIRPVVEVDCDKLIKYLEE